MTCWLDTNISKMFLWNIALQSHLKMILLLADKALVYRRVEKAFLSPHCEFDIRRTSIIKPKCLVNALENTIVICLTMVQVFCHTLLPYQESLPCQFLRRCIGLCEGGVNRLSLLFNRVNLSTTSSSE